MSKPSCLLIRHLLDVTIRLQTGSRATSGWRRVARSATTNLNAGPMQTAAQDSEDSDTPTE